MKTDTLPATPPIHGVCASTAVAAADEVAAGLAYVAVAAVIFAVLMGAGAGSWVARAAGTEAARMSTPKCSNPVVVVQRGVQTPQLRCGDDADLQALCVRALTATDGAREGVQPAPERGLQAGDAVYLDGPAATRCRVAPHGMEVSLRLMQGVPLALNEASADDLQQVPGIGPTLARRIVEDRTKNGPFATVDDLERVKGVGPTRLAQWHRFLATDPAAPAPSP